MALPSGADAATIVLGTPDPSQGGETLAKCAPVPGCTTKTVVPTHLSDPGADLLAPADGTIVSWRVKGAPPPYLRLRVVRDEGNGAFKGIATSGVAKVSDGASENFLKMAIDAGEQLGLELAAPLSSESTILGALSPAGSWSLWDPGLPDNSTAAPTSVNLGAEPLFNATVELFRPVVFQVSPVSGPTSGGFPLYITGRHLTEVTEVSFGGVAAQVLEQIPEQVLVLAPPHAAGRVDVVISTAGGPSLDSTVDDFTYLAPQGAPAPDTTEPRLSGLKISPGVFLAAPSGPSAIASTALGADVAYRDSEAATTKFTIERRKGRRYVRVAGSFEHADSAGKNRFRFSGRVGRRSLPPGRYRLVARATDGSGNRSGVKRQEFRVMGVG